MKMIRPLLAAVVLSATALFPHSSHAAFLFCNKTQTPIEAAFGYREEVLWISEGWWQIQPGQCARAFSRPLTQRFYFYHAHVLAPPSPDGKPPLTWSGKYRFCVDTKAFHVEGDGNCEGRGYQEKGFQEIDVGQGQHNYTLTFEDGSSR